MKVFVTGAAGFVGSHLVPYLLKNGYEVTALVKVKKEKKIIDPNAIVIIGDLAKISSWKNSLKGHDLIIHLAAQISSKTEDKFKKNNVIATKNLITMAEKSYIKKIILFSSAAVTSIRKDWYAQSKEEKEKLVKNSKISYIIIRPSMMYGPGDTKNMGWLINFIKTFPIIPLPGGGKFGRQPIYIGDICKIVIRIINSDINNKIYEIHGFEYVTMARMVETIIKNLNKKRIVIKIPMVFLILAFAIGEKILKNPKFTVDQIKSLISGEKFKGEAWWKTFDIIPTRFDRGIARMIKSK